MRPKVALWPVDMDFPLTAAFPASGSRNPYLYIEERERHPVFSDLCKAERDPPLPPAGEGVDYNLIIHG